jgi:ADP-heptose:LPS heptosyltransferase
VRRPPPSKYIVDEKFELLKSVGFSTTDIRPRVSITLKDREVPQAFALRHKEMWLEAQSRVAISPTHRRPQRRWDPEKFAQLADRLVVERNACVVWLWGPGEEDYVDGIIRLCTQKTLKAPATGFRELAVLIELCDLFIGTSNGPSHLAVAMDVPSLQLHGHTRASAWCPDSVPYHQAIQSQEYGRVKKPTLNAISVEEVFRACNV